MRASLDVATPPWFPLFRVCLDPEIEGVLDCYIPQQFRFRDITFNRA